MEHRTPREVLCPVCWGSRAFLRGANLADVSPLGSGVTCCRASGAAEPLGLCPQQVGPAQIPLPFLGSLQGSSSDRSPGLLFTSSPAGWFSAGTQYVLCKACQMNK